MVFENGVKNIQAAAYNGTGTIYALAYFRWHVDFEHTKIFVNIPHLQCK